MYMASRCMACGIRISHAAPRVPRAGRGWRWFLMITSRALLDTFLRAVGGQLRRARLDRRWSRARVVAALNGAVKSSNAIVAYEKGTRTMPVTRLVELCRLYQVDPGTVVDRAYRTAIAEHNEENP